MKTSKFKMTELGPIPEEWECRKIGELAKVCTGNRNTQDKNDNGLYPFYVRSQIVERIDEYGFDTEGVITVGDGVGTGKVFHYVNGKFALHQRCYLIDSFDCQLNAKYFYKIFSERFFDRVMQMTAKSSVDSVRREMITGMVIPVPPLPEQERIAEALSDVDALLSAMTTLIEKKRAIKQGAMQELLGMRNVECGMRNVPRRRLAGFSGAWVEKRLGECGKLVRDMENPFDSPNKQFVEYSMPAFDAGKKAQVVLGRNMLSSRTRIQGEVLLFNKLNVRQRRIWYVNACPNNAICSSEFLPYYSDVINLLLLAYILDTEECTRHFIDVSKGTSNSQKRIAPKDFEDYMVLLPPSLAEQQAIAAVLSDMDAEIAALEAKRAKYESIKQGMMQELLTGRTRLL